MPLELSVYAIPCSGTNSEESNALCIKDYLLYMLTYECMSYESKHIFPVLDDIFRLFLCGDALRLVEELAI